MKKKGSYWPCVAMRGLRLVAVILTAVWAQVAAAGPERFKLTMGNGVPVCEAYLKRLNQTYFPSHERCDRPEDDSVPGFIRLNRIYLDASEIKKLYLQVKGFLGSNRDPRWYFDHPEQRSPLARTPEWYDRQLTEEIEDYVREADNWGPTGAPMMRHFRYEPPIDIDNDGIPDQVILWREMVFQCGKTYSLWGNKPTYTSTHALILDERGNIDAARVQTLFGHPKNGYLVIRKSQSSDAVIQKEIEGFRPIGTGMSIFVFEGKTYFDTFYDSSGDIENQRTKDPHISETLAVFKHEQGRLASVCELQLIDNH